jgi:hypothetical protein
LLRHSLLCANLVYLPVLAQRHSNLCSAEGILDREFWGFLRIDGAALADTSRAFRPTLGLRYEFPSMNTGHLSGIATIPVGICTCLPSQRRILPFHTLACGPRLLGRTLTPRPHLNCSNNSAAEPARYSPLYYSIAQAILLGQIESITFIVRVEFSHSVDQIHLERLGTLFIITIYSECPCAQIRVPRFRLHLYYYLDFD